ncbi:DUF4129 domain-containing protein [Intrasporangium sp.]|uniref:DUF4129 domain-containing protein n=1 Tax=Intrasporangium sp. TaxID=1925024 RepID=UPI0029398035|nr:DUF4129 domain-containing protein [Intrasporangium sp.]MDV3221730.1 DUF4129 domain-containing protein [Intrasporangium sp.]
MSRRGRTAVVGGSIGAVVVMAALVVAASGRSPDLMSRPRTAVDPRAPTWTLGPELTALPQESRTPEGGSGWDPSGLLAVIVQLLVVSVVVALLALLVLALRDLLRRIRPQVTSHAEPGFAVPEVPTEILQGADSGLENLGQGAPRNAIVAAWVALEAAAGAAGLPRHPAETSTEYVARVLATWEVDPRSLRELSALYREARFSTHPLTETHRRRAITALSAIRSDLERAPRASATTLTDAEGR